MRRVTIAFILAVILAFVTMFVVVASLKAWQTNSESNAPLQMVDLVQESSGNRANPLSQLPATDTQCGPLEVKRIDLNAADTFSLEISTPLTVEARELYVEWPAQINGALRAVSLDEQSLWQEQPVATSPATIKFSQPGTFSPYRTSRFGIKYQESKIAQAPYTVVITGSTPAGDGCVLRHVEEVRRVVRLQGLIQAIPVPPPYGQWKIGGKVVNVSNQTNIASPLYPPPQVGDEAFVFAYDGNVLDAISISWKPRSGRMVIVPLSGIIAQVPENLIGTWVLTVTGSSRVSVEVNANTTISFTQQPQPGHRARVEAIRDVAADGVGTAVLIARQIIVETPEEAQQSVQFEGPIQVFTTTYPADWIVGGITVTIQSPDIVVGQPKQGLLAEVSGRRQDGKVLASSIHIRPPANLDQPGAVVFFTGTVSALPTGSPPFGQWSIWTTRFGLLSVTVDDGTLIDEVESRLQLGVPVEVRAQVTPDLGLHALRVTARRSTASSASEATPGLKIPIPSGQGRTPQSMVYGERSLMSETASIDGDDARDPAIALDGNSLLHLVYVSRTPEGPVLRFRYRQGTTWVTTPFEVTNAEEPVLATDRAGRVHLAYTYLNAEGKYIVQYRCRTPGPNGAWSRIPKTFLSSDSTPSMRPAIALGPGPDNTPSVYISWSQVVGDETEIYYAIMNNAGESCPGPWELTPASPMSNDPSQGGPRGTASSLAVDDKGRVHVAWQALHPINPDNDAEYDVFYARGDPNMRRELRWSDELVASAPGLQFSGRDSKLPTLVVEPDTGAAYLAWEQWLDNNGTRSQIYYSFDVATSPYTPNLSAPELLFAELFQSRKPHLIFDSWKHLYLAWVEGLDVRLGVDVHGRRGDNVVARALVERTGTPPVLDDPALTIDSTRRCNQVLHLVWSQAGETHPSQIQYLTQALSPSYCLFMPFVPNGRAP